MTSVAALADFDAQFPSRVNAGSPAILRHFPKTHHKQAGGDPQFQRVRCRRTL